MSFPAMEDNDIRREQRQHQQQQRHPAPARQLLQLIDEEEWFNTYGLREAGDESSSARRRHETEGDRETKGRVASEVAYQREMHAKIFRDEETGQERKQREQLDQWNDDALEIVTTRSESSAIPELEAPDSGNHGKLADYAADSTSATIHTDEVIILRANLKAIASHSDTVFAMASNRRLFERGDDESKEPPNALRLSLIDYSTESVQSFLEALLFPNNDHDIPPDHVIDCCRLAHYLQCQDLLDFIVDEYLMTAVDNENCRFLCKLADELSLPRLWEAAVNYMLSSLDPFEDREAGATEEKDDTHTKHERSDKEPSDLWEDLSPALKREIQALRGILRSSNRKQVYFSTYHEYLGLLAEQHQYYKERLEDARHGVAMQTAQENRMRTELDALRDEQASNGLFSYGNRRLDRQIEDIERRLAGLLRAKNYASSKIAQQSKRVDTLKALLIEQKKVFGGGSSFNSGDNGKNGSRFFERKKRPETP